MSFSIMSTVNMNVDMLLLETLNSVTPERKRYEKICQMYSECVDGIEDLQGTQDAVRRQFATMGSAPDAGQGMLEDVFQDKRAVCEQNMLGMIARINIAGNALKMKRSLLQQRYEQLCVEEQRINEELIREMTARQQAQEQEGLR